MKMIYCGMAAEFSFLDTLHPMVCVAWDRDGVAEALDKIKPSVRLGITDTLYPRLYNERDHNVGDPPGLKILSVFYGNYGEPLAFFVTGTKPRWILLEKNIAEAMCIDGPSLGSISEWAKV